MNWNEIFVYYMMIPMVWVFGGIGNITGLILFFRRPMHKIGPVYAYKILLLSDLYFFTQMLNSFSTEAFGIDLNSITDLGCKIGYFFTYATVNWSPMLLVYISIEKLISIKFPAKRFILRKKKYQILYFIVIVIFYGLINLPALFYYEIRQFVVPTYANQTIVIKTCYYVDSFGMQLLSILYLVNKVVIPFLLMAICSILLSATVYKLRKRIIQNFLTLATQNSESAENQRYKKDIRLALTSLILNVIYLILNAPLALFLSVSTNVRDNPFGLWIVVNMCYIGFGVNFYLMLFSNHLIRQEFIKLFKK